MEYFEIVEFNRDLMENGTEPVKEETPLTIAMYSHTDFSGTILSTNGRISSEILSKVLRCLMPGIAADGVPTTQTVKPAREAV